MYAPLNFRMDFLKTFKYPLERQNYDGVRVKCSEAVLLIISNPVWWVVMNNLQL